jgi:hypothetical protein
MLCKGGIFVNKNLSFKKKCLGGTVHNS